MREEKFKHNDFKSYSRVLFKTLRGKETWLTGCVGKISFPLKVGGFWPCSEITDFGLVFQEFIRFKDLSMLIVTWKNRDFHTCVIWLKLILDHLKLSKVIPLNKLGCPNI